MKREWNKYRMNDDENEGRQRELNLWDGECFGEMNESKYESTYKSAWKIKMP